jgi:hypothetical protein
MQTPTLFDFITTPIKSPTIIKPNDSPIIVNDFKNRLVQNQITPTNTQNQNIISNYHTPVQQHHPPFNHSNVLNGSGGGCGNKRLSNNNLSSNNMIMEVEQSHANTGEIEMSQEKIKQFQDLSSNIKNLLGNNEKENLALIAKFYSQLILSNLI